MYRASELRSPGTQDPPRCPFPHQLNDSTTYILRGYSNLLTIVDSHTCWVEAAPLADTAALIVANALQVWVSRFGCPVSIAMDQGAQFTSAPFMNLELILGTVHFTSAAYQPSANGTVEHVHHQLKAALAAHNTPEHWLNPLPIVPLSIRSSLKQDLGCTAAEMVYGHTLGLPEEFFTPSPVLTLSSQQQILQNLRATFCTLHPPAPRLPLDRQVFVSPHLHNASHVFVRHDAIQTVSCTSLQQSFKVLAHSPNTMNSSSAASDIISVHISIGAIFVRLVCCIDP